MLADVSHDAGDARERLVVLTDRVTATQSISFRRPVDEGGEAVASLELFTHQAAHLTYLTREEFWVRQKPSVLFLSRQAHPRVFPVLQLARQHGVPTVFHIDDDLLDVTTALESDRYDYYSDPERLRVLRTALGLVDLVYASTPALGERLVDHGIHTEVFAGEIYCSVDHAQLPTTYPSLGPVIGYMGSGGHARDLAMVVPAITRLMQDIPSLRFETFGTISMPEGLQRMFGSRCGHHVGVGDYKDFLGRLAELGWWVGMAPLEDNSFNRCKADTKWVEYASAGIAVVASDIPVYHKACDGGAGIVAADTQQWCAGLAALIQDGKLRRDVVAKARSKLATDYSHGVLRNQLLEVVRRARSAYERHQLDN